MICLSPHISAASRRTPIQRPRYSTDLPPTPPCKRRPFALDLFPVASIKIHPLQRYIAACAQVVYSGQTSVVARVSLTDYRGNIVLDTFVRPTYALVNHQITDYRQSQTNLHPEHLANAPLLEEIRHQVATLIHDKIIVGYALWEFLSVMGIPHPAIDTRDVAIFLPFRRSLRTTQSPPLPILVNRLMGRNMALQQRDHPVENARAALDLFRSSEQFWESLIDTGSWPIHYFFVRPIFLTATSSIVSPVPVIFLTGGAVALMHPCHKASLEDKYIFLGG